MIAAEFYLRKLSVTLCILLVIPVMLSAQEAAEEVRYADTIDTSIDIFEYEDPMNITLTLDLKKYQRGKFEGKYMDVDFLYEVNDTLRLKKSMRIRPRGNFRRSYCSVAPFWLNIRKADVANQHLQDTKKIKVVTNCQGSKVYNDYVLKEYLAYKIYNILSPLSFRVRLVKLRYVDTGRKNKVTEGWAFLIEPEEMLAERHGAIVVKRDDLVMPYMRQEDLDLVALFQYMIGNGDYSISGRHNLKILGMPGFGTEGYTPVPYDFDYSGLVDAAYALPGENLGISSVRERYFLGACRDDATYLETIEQLNQYREEILSLVDNFEYLDSKNKKSVYGYLEEYFALAADGQYLITSLKNTCR